MGASKEHHFTAVTHRWRARAKAAEDLLAEVEQRLVTIGSALDRDRREPDKVLLYVEDLNRLVINIDQHLHPEDQR